MQSPPGTLRLFFALLPSPAQCAELADLVAPLVTRLQAQRVPPENFHATLCFVGPVAAEKLAALREAAAGIRGRTATLRFDALEFWEKPQVLCATASEPVDSSAAHELAAVLATAGSAAGFSPDVKPFRPHLTLARKVQRATAAELLPCALMPPLVMHADKFVLMESRRGDAGSIYSVVDSWSLYDDKSG